MRIVTAGQLMTIGIVCAISALLISYVDFGLEAPTTAKFIFLILSITFFSQAILTEKGK